jgi:hypothetical protein
VITRLVVDSQKANMNATRSKHGDLKFHIDRRATPRLGTDRWHELHFSINVALGLSWETLDAPHNGLLLRLILGAAKESLNLGLGRILGNGNLDNHMSSKELIRKVGNHLEVNRDPVGAKT